MYPPLWTPPLSVPPLSVPPLSVPTLYVPTLYETMSLVNVLYLIFSLGSSVVCSAPRRSSSRTHHHIQPQRMCRLMETC